MDSDSQLEHDGQAPVRRPPDDAPELRNKDEFDAAHEGEIHRFSKALREDHATAHQMKLPGLEGDLPGNRTGERLKPD